MDTGQHYTGRTRQKAKGLDISQGLCSASIVTTG